MIGVIDMLKKILVLLLAVSMLGVMVGCKDKPKEADEEVVENQPDPFKTAIDPEKIAEEREIEIKDGVDNEGDEPNPQVWQFHVTEMNGQDLKAFAESDYGMLVIAEVTKSFGGWDGSQPYSVQQSEADPNLYTITYRKQHPDSALKQMVVTVNVSTREFVVVEKPHTVE